MKRAQLYQEWRWRQAEVLRVPSDRSCSAKQKNSTISTKFRQNLPCMGRFPKPARKMLARWPTTHISHPRSLLALGEKNGTIKINIGCIFLGWQLGKELLNCKFFFRNVIWSNGIMDLLATTAPI
jgi:hypothetical protein